MILFDIEPMWKSPRMWVLHRITTGIQAFLYWWMSKLSKILSTGVGWC